MSLQPVQETAVAQYIEQQNLSGVISIMKNNAAIISQGAKAKFTAKLGEVRFYNLTEKEETGAYKIDAARLTELDAELSEIQTRADKAESIIKNERMPLTKAFDAIKSHFTTHESACSSLVDDAKTLRKKIAAEIDRRNKESEQKRFSDTDRAQELIDYKMKAKIWAITAAVEATKEMATLLCQKFYKIELPNFDVYRKNLDNYKPAMAEDKVKALLNGFSFPWRFHDPTQEQLPSLTYEELFNIANPIFFAGVTFVKEDIQGRVQMRIMELESGKDDGVMRLPEDIKRAITAISSVTGMEEKQAQGAALVNKAVVATTIAAETETIQQAAGTAKKGKLTPTTHEQWQMVIRMWMEKQFTHQNMEELEKKFKFMLTYLNSVGKSTGEWPAGVPVIDDYIVKK